jgi:hypothetical protein
MPWAVGVSGEPISAWRYSAARFNERTLHRQRQFVVTCVGSLVELRRQIGLLGERAEPFAILVDEATKFPRRKLELDPSKRSVQPCAGLDRLIDPSSLSGPVQQHKVHAGSWDAVGHEIGGDRRRKPKRIRQPIETALAFRNEQHVTITANITALCDRARKMVPKAIKKPGGRECRDIWIS